MKHESMIRWLTRRPNTPLGQARPLLRTGKTQTVRVSRLTESLGFYQNELGFRALQTVPGCMAWLRHPSADLVLMPMSAVPGRWDGPRPPETLPRHYRIAAQGLFGWHLRLQADWHYHNLPVPTLTLQPWDALEMTLQDPEGNTLHFEEWLSSSSTKTD
jgi:hypothetical protein